ncbi:hypothetical protein [Microbacterium sp. Marseille-Q6965]|uniref:hypothetical protein n=1 Tax=Microbacterium sp. Marseille-Q6965 TaxID=2965072 RepID=UPI0021B8377A|nr:hypothetical protein [Microbacterium sp. Marseille-Q6965]
MTDMASKAQETAEQAQGAVREVAAKTRWNPLTLLGKWGVRSSHLYLAGFLSIAATFLKWALTLTHDRREQADRWGLFIGEWAPTFFALGVAMKHEEESR